MSVVKMWNPNKVLKGIDLTNEKLVKNIALTLSRKAKQNLYPGHGLVTGNLKRSIRAVVSKTKQMFGQRAEVRAGGDTDVAPGVASPVDYAAHVELGTYKMSARPYMTPAIEDFSKSDLDKCVEASKK